MRETGGWARRDHVDRLGMVSLWYFYSFVFSFVLLIVNSDYKKGLNNDGGRPTEEVGGGQGSWATGGGIVQLTGRRAIAWPVFVICGCSFFVALIFLRLRWPLVWIWPKDKITYLLGHLQLLDKLTTCLGFR